MLNNFQKKEIRSIVVLMSLLVISIYSLHASEVGQFVPIKQQNEIFLLEAGQDEVVSNNGLEQKNGNRRRLREVKIFLFSKEHEKFFKERKERKRLKIIEQERWKKQILFFDRNMGELEEYQRERRRWQKAREEQPCPEIHIRVRVKKVTESRSKIKPTIRFKNGALATIGCQAQSKKQAQKLTRSQGQTQSLNRVQSQELGRSCWDCLIDCCLGRQI